MSKKFDDTYTYFLNFLPNLKQCAMNNFNVSGTCTKYVVLVVWCSIATNCAFMSSHCKSVDLFHLPFVVSTIDLLILRLSD